MSLNILLTCAGRRHYLAQYFKSVTDLVGRTIGVDASLTAPALYACDGFYKVSSVFDSVYVNDLIEVINKESIDLVFPLNDFELPVLVNNLDRITSNTAAKVCVPDQAGLALCADKYSTARHAFELGIQCPKSFIDLAQALDAIEQGLISYPLMVKPRYGSASFALFICNTKQELIAAYHKCQGSITASSFASFTIDKPVLIQEFIKGDEYGVDVLFGKQSNYIGHTAKKKLAMRAGETDKATIVAPDMFTEQCKSLAYTLNYTGNLDCDFIVNDAGVYLLELNPRFGGGYPFTHMYGVNHIEYLLLDHLGRTNEISYKGFTDGNQTFAKCDTLVAVANPDDI